RDCHRCQDRANSAPRQRAVAPSSRTAEDWQFDSGCRIGQGLARGGRSREGIGRPLRPRALRAAAVEGDGVMDALTSKASPLRALRQLVEYATTESRELEMAGLEQLLGAAPLAIEAGL